MPRGRHRSRQLTARARFFDTICGKHGADEITAREDDRIAAGPGADQVRAGRGADVVDGGAGGDMLEGGDGRDRLLGGRGT